MAKKPSTYFSSDFHFHDYSSWTDSDNNFHQRGVILFERTQFDTIEEHDEYIINKLDEWGDSWAAGSTFWVLGDWGDTDYLWTIDVLRSKGIICKFCAGNHDRAEDMPLFREHFDEVYEYPVFLSKKLVVSHEPIAVYDDTINIHGHLHSAKLADINHINANIHVNNYQFVSWNHIQKTFGNLPKYDRTFLNEPYANDYVFTQPKDDVVMDKHGRIDLSASRVWQKIHNQK